MSTKQIVLTEKAPKPIGPYSQAVKTGNLLFCSGQIALEPNGNLAATDLEGQTRQVMENMRAVLEAGGASFETVVKTTIFLKDMGDFPRVNEIYGTYFKANPPARSTIEVSRLPKDVSVEIEAIAICR